jgi:hypothetical protein
MLSLDRKMLSSGKRNINCGSNRLVDLLLARESIEHIYLAFP